MGSVEDPDIQIELLRDIGAVMDSGKIVMKGIVPSAALLEKLLALEHRPWATWGRGKALTAHGLARLLKPFGVHPDNGLRTSRGYRADALEEVIARYLPSEASQCHSTQTTKSTGASAGEHASIEDNGSVAVVPQANGTAVTLRHFVGGDMRRGGDTDGEGGLHEAGHPDGRFRRRGRNT